MKVVRNEHPKGIAFFCDVKSGELLRVNDKPYDNIFMKMETFSDYDKYNAVNIETGYPSIFNDDMIVYPIFGEFVESNNYWGDDNYD